MNTSGLALGHLSRRKDLVGQKFGALTVTKMLYDYRRKPSGQAVTYCECICDCGNTVIRSANKIKTSKNPSCGCLTKQTVRNACAKKIEGQKFGRLTVNFTLWDSSPVKVNCTCDCGNTVVLSRNDVMSGHTQSCGCLQKERASKSNTKDFTGIISDFGIELVKPLYLKVRSDNSDNQKQVWIWECKCSCGKLFEALPANILSGKITSCGCNRSSSREKYIANILDGSDVIYDTEVTFNDCKNKYALRFDFGIYDEFQNIKALIEYDGEQHFKPVSLFGGEIGFLNSQKRDEIKNNYCIEKNIPLYRIPYTFSLEEIRNKIIEIVNNIKNA